QKGIEISGIILFLKLMTLTIFNYFSSKTCPSSNLIFFNTLYIFVKNQRICVVSPYAAAFTVLLSPLYLCALAFS
uniref:hypothetical protein n=1 Tax=Enterocloster clostridioformis TaxID=1531 RepID=UPI00242EC555